MAVRYQFQGETYYVDAGEEWENIIDGIERKERRAFWKYKRPLKGVLIKRVPVRLALGVRIFKIWLGGKDMKRQFLTVKEGAAFYNSAAAGEPIRAAETAAAWLDELKEDGGSTLYIAGENGNYYRQTTLGPIAAVRGEEVMARFPEVFFTDAPPAIPVEGNPPNATAEAPSEPPCDETEEVEGSRGQGNAAPRRFQGLKRRVCTRV